MSSSISGKLEPIHFTIMEENNKQVVELVTAQSGHTFRREFEWGTPIKEMLAKVKADLFSD